MSFRKYVYIYIYIYIYVYIYIYTSCPNTYYSFIFWVLQQTLIVRKCVCFLKTKSVVCFPCVLFHYSFVFDLAILFFSVLKVIFWYYFCFWSCLSDIFAFWSVCLACFFWRFQFSCWIVGLILWNVWFSCFFFKSPLFDFV